MSPDAWTSPHTCGPFGPGLPSLFYHNRKHQFVLSERRAISPVVRVPVGVDYLDQGKLDTDKWPEVALMVEADGDEVLLFPDEFVRYGLEAVDVGNGEIEVRF